MSILRVDIKEVIAAEYLIKNFKKFHSSQTSIFWKF